MKLFIIIGSVLALLSCLSLPIQPIKDEHLNNFSKYCYTNMENDIKQFSGKVVMNCGFYDWYDKGTTNLDLENGIKCAKEAYKKNMPFKFGDFNILGDSYICEAYASNFDGSILKIFVDHDSSGALRFNSDSMILYKKKCKDPEFLELGVYVKKENCTNLKN